MKKLLLTLTALLVGLTFNAQDRASLTIEITDLKNTDGYLLIALFDQPDGFPDGEAALHSIRLKVLETTMVACFKNLEPGIYAVSYVHDENDNGLMDNNVMGIPKEKYGVSNNIKMGFGPPAFDEAKFSLEAGDKTITIRPSN